MGGGGARDLGDGRGRGHCSGIRTGPLGRFGESKFDDLRDDGGGGLTFARGSEAAAEAGGWPGRPRGWRDVLAWGQGGTVEPKGVEVEKRRRGRRTA